MDNIIMVLDYETGLVYQYNIQYDGELDYTLVEQVLIEQGHDLDQVYWMECNGEQIQKTNIYLWLR